tara:strand:- start:1193 stop:1486 length:294 start_codon:yes stop_codon:yes gene_type:complete
MLRRNADKELLKLYKSVAVQHVDNVLQITCPIKRANILYRFITHMRERVSISDRDSLWLWSVDMGWHNNGGYSDTIIQMINEIVGTSKEELDYVKAN